MKLALARKERCVSECNELGHTAKTCQEDPTASQNRRQSTPQDGSGQGSNDPMRVIHALLSNSIYLAQLFIFTCTNNSSNEHLVQVQLLVQVVL